MARHCSQKQSSKRATASRNGEGCKPAFKGRSRKGGSDPLYEAEHAADPDSTLFIYVGLSILPSLAQELMMHHCLPFDTPVVAIERETIPQKLVVSAILKDLIDEVTSSNLVSPILIVIGKDVALSPFWPHYSKEAAILVET